MKVSRRFYKWYYDRIGSVYYNLLIKFVFWPFGGETAFRREMLDPIEFKPGEKIFEMCCGTGGATFALAQKAGADARIIAMDISDGQIAVARKNNVFPNVQFIQGNVTRTDYEDESFDRVMIPHAIHEMQQSNRLKTLREARRLLRPGGRLAVLELDDPPELPVRLFIGLWFFYWLPFNFETPTRREMLKCGLDNEVREAGFDDVTKTNLHRGVFQVVQGIKGR